MNHSKIGHAAAFCVATLLALEASIAQGQGKPAANAPSAERVALVIGNAAYKQSPLANPVNDATDMALALRTAGFRVIARHNANRREMREAFDEFATALRRAQVGLFYFAGHGVQVRGNNYLIPVGAEIKSEADVEIDAVDANYALSTMEEAQAKVSILVLDACRDNPFARTFRSASRGLAQMQAATGSFIAFATAPGTQAADVKGRNGVFTKHLLDSLRQHDTDTSKVFNRTRAAVVRETAGKQTPWDASSLIGEFSFRAPPEASASTPAGTTPASTPSMTTPSSQDAELVFWTSIQNSRDPHELNAYLDQYPNGRFAGLARARLKSAEAPKVPPAQVASGVPAAPPATPQARPPTAPSRASLQSMQRGTVFRDCEGCPEMVVIPPGRFVMDSPASEEGRSNNEGPQHEVTISRAIAVGKFEVTFAEWEACVAAGGCQHRPEDSGWGKATRPVMNFNWNDAKEYAKWLSSKTSKTYRLLTEAEGEYAARAGSETRYPWGNDAGQNRANFESSGSQWSAKQTAPVGSFEANKFGLHDMIGNVWEWTEDCWNASYNGGPHDGSAWTSGNCDLRVLRGGAWSGNPGLARAAARSWMIVTAFRYNNFGFRVARTDF